MPGVDFGSLEDFALSSTGLVFILGGGALSWLVFTKSVLQWLWDKLKLVRYKLGGYWITVLWLRYKPLVHICRPSAIMGHVRGVENPRV